MKKISSKPEILIVDDDRINTQVLSRKLSNRGFDVSSVENGELCLNLLTKRSFDLILLDIMMPGLSGDSVLTYIREKHQSMELPVIMITAKDTTEDIVHFLEKGANDYLTKPADIDICIARIQTQLNLRNYYLECLKKKEIETLNAMIVTYNHEINNPLTIAMGLVQRAKRDKDLALLDRIQGTLNRIEKIVTEIRKITKGEIEYTNYVDQSMMLQIKKAK